MKRILENLLIVGAVVLCGLCALQWSRESQLRAQLKATNEDLSAARVNIQSLQQATNRLEAQVTAFLAKVTSLEETNRAMNQRLVLLERDFRKAESQNRTLTNQIAVYKDAVEERNKKLVEQQERINAAITERNEVVKKSNEIVKEHNAVAAKYNELAEAFEKLQEQFAKATNALAQASAPKK